MPRFDVSPQGSPGWLKARLGNLSASRMSDAMAFSKKGEPLEARTKYMIELCAERLADRAVDRMITKAMEHGLEYEPFARDLYEEKTGNLVMQVGFALHDEIEFFGASSDGLVGHDGMIEIKCQATVNHIDMLHKGEIPERFKPQMIAQCAVLKRPWVDFVAYDPRLPAHTQLFIRRFTPTVDQIAEVEDHARRFLTELELMFDQVVANAA